MKKRAFTFAEVSFIFFILTIITVVMFRTIKPKEIVYDHMYYSIYNQLADAQRETLFNNDIYTESEGTRTYDLSKFAGVFNNMANFVGDPKDGHTGTDVSFDTDTNKYNIYHTLYIPYFQ